MIKLGFDYDSAGSGVGVGGRAGVTGRDRTLGVKTSEHDIKIYCKRRRGTENNMGNIPDYSFQNFHGRKLTVSQEVGTYLRISFDPVTSFLL